MSLFIETLEDRSLMSATHPAVLHAALVNPVVVEDQAAIIAARQKIRTDTVLFSAETREAQIGVRVLRSQDLSTLAGDRRRFAADRGSPNARLADLGQIQIDQAKLRTDTVSSNQNIKSVSGERRIALADDRIALRQATLKLRLDRTSRPL